MKTPLYILIFFIVMFVSSYVVLGMFQNKLTSSLSTLKKYEKLSNKFQTLKNNWANSDEMLRRVDGIIKYAGVNNAIVTQTNGEYKIVINKIDLKTSHKLLNKLLNENINLSEITISRDKLSFSVGLIK